jgi:lipid A 3-O-deacylase
MPLIIIRVFVILVFAVVLSPLAAAQTGASSEAQPDVQREAQPEAKWRVRHLNFDNDDGFPVFAGGPSDRFYTHGVRVIFGKRIFDDSDEAAALPAWARIAARRCSACSIYPTFSVGQEAYTPQLIESPDPQPGEHPWAAWLYGAVGAIVDTPGGGRHQYQIQVGVTGDSSRAQELQDIWHRVINRPLAQGWDNQLGSDAGINAYYRFRTIWRRSSGTSRVHWDFGPAIEAAIGTMRTHASFGGIARIGRHAGDSLDSPIEGPVEPPLWPVQFNRVRIYGFLGANVRVVGHNYFLEGSRFHDDPFTVERKRYVREFTLGVTAHYKGWALTYAIIRRTKDFERLVGEDTARHSYGSLLITRGIR